MKKDFESRFMPNVKFRSFKYSELVFTGADLGCDTIDKYIRLDEGSYYNAITTPFLATNKKGKISFYIHTEEEFNKLDLPEVSICEAMPELVPGGMAYNKESDILVPISNAEFIKPINKNHRSYNIGSSNYATMKIQPWDIWKDWNLNPWDADIVKRISRTKEIPGKSFEEARIEDYGKIKHICDERISQLKEANDN